ncbi:hypothetical protein COLO4_26494 [Corchorus olitorius]|uniref:Uncharacterized protein n=1 Tax=Corchorus olitorius TaxID=93759 RepID=A0A1R3HWX9_9ROSI|nr:hypothetical protein COLO4_26494 [Corchorus olitorius]
MESKGGGGDGLMTQRLKGSKAQTRDTCENQHSTSLSTI